MDRTVNATRPVTEVATPPAALNSGTELFVTPPHASFFGADPIAAALGRLNQTQTPKVSHSDRPGEGNSSDSASTAEQRHFPRRSAEGFVSVVRYPASAELTPQWTDWLMQTTGLTGELVDLSRSGLALLLLQPLTVGDALVVRLSHQETADTLDAVVEVVRVVDLGDQRWKITAQFTKPLAFDAAYGFARHDQDALPPLFLSTMT
jgi:hypothetical protein